MFGMRCPECGEVRWSIIARVNPDRECPACGAQMVDERRFPGRLGGRYSRGERRDESIAATTARGSSSGRK